METTPSIVKKKMRTILNLINWGEGLILNFFQSDRKSLRSGDRHSSLMRRDGRVDEIRVFREDSSEA